MQEIAELVSDANQRFAEFDRAVEFDLSFGLDSQHYENEPDQAERRASRIRPRDPGVYRVWAYSTRSTLKRSPLRIEARPGTPDVTDEQAERARRRVEGIFTDWRRNYSDSRRRMVGGAIGARVGAIELCYDPAVGLFFDYRQSKSYRWAEGFLHPHHPMNPWAADITRMPLWKVKSMKGWRVPANLQGDPGYRRETAGSSEYLGPQAQPAESEGSAESFVTVVKFRARFQREVPTRRKAKPTMELEPGMRHMACEWCGWTSPPQAEVLEEMPPVAPCPACGELAERVDHVPNEQDGVKYKNGKRLIICAPFSNAPEPFYDDDWEFDYPTFPIAWMVGAPVPHKAIGQSVSSVLKTPLSAKNALIRISYETLIRSMPYWVIPPDGVHNVYGLDFAFQPEDGNIMVSEHPPSMIEVKQGQGVNQSIFALMDRLDSVFRTNEDTNQVAMTPTQLSEVKVGALEQHSESGNISVDDYGVLLYEAETPIVACVAAALREIPSEEVGYADPMTGEYRFERTGGPTMAPLEIVVAAGHGLDDLDSDEMAAYMTLLQMPPEARAGFAALKHIDPSVLQKLPVMPPAPGSGAPVNAPGAAPAPGPPMNGVPNG